MLQKMAELVSKVTAPVTSLVKPVLLCLGLVLVAAIGLDVKVIDVPLVSGSQADMLLAGLLVFAGK